MINPSLFLQSAAQSVSNPTPPAGVDPGLAAALNGSVGGPSAADKNDPNSWSVWLGGMTTPAYTGKMLNQMPLMPHVSESATHGDHVVSIADAMNMPYTWDDKEITSAMKKFKAAGYTIGGFDDLVKAWQNVTQIAAGRFTLGGAKITPWDALELQREQGTGTAGATRTSTSKTVSEISQANAWSALRSVVKDQLGRDPSDQEVRDFTYRMQSLAASNPSISKTTQTTDANGNVTSSTKTTPGFSADDLAKSALEDAQSDPDWAEHQAATTYYNVALQSLGALGG